MLKRLHSSNLAAAVLAAAALACSGADAPEAAADAASAPANAGAAAEGLIAGTPPGGLADWVADVREGTGELAGRVASAAADARQQAVDLYVGRQEYIEMYYGPAGRLTKGEALGVAVEEAEARFHALMQLLGETPPPDSARVAAAVSELSSQYERVMEAAKAAGVPLVPRAGAAPAGGAS